jgi:hypothetical protein
MNPKTMKHFCIVLLFLVQFLFAGARTSRALIIGINQYKAPADSMINSPRALWRNLAGCTNDAEAIRDLVIAKYGFASSDITSLFNTEASRERIIAELKRLVSVSAKGDVVFIFYAGHGSQVVNSLSVEKDKKDETIVPADAYRGVADIRDKELAVYFNQLLDKGVLLTVIFDSCHSGSVGRGLLYDVPGVRYIEENPIDAKDPSEPPRPEDRGALIISAAQDDEFAKEIKDENNLTHGAFTLAVIKALEQNAVDAPVEDIFNSTVAIMKYFGKTQQPVLAANEERKAQTLFGLPKGTLRNRFTIPVSKSDPAGIELMGGFAFGLSTGVKLKSLNGNDTIQVVEMIGANRSIAKLISKKRSEIAPGNLFEIITWTSSTASALKVYVPADVLNAAQLLLAIRTVQGMKANKKFNMVEDLTKSTPERIFYYSGNSWWYQDAKEGKRAIGNNLSASAPVSTSSFVNIPPAAGMMEGFHSALEGFNNVQIVSDPGESLYTLIGTVNEKNELSYAFVKTNIAVEDSSGSLPARTDYFVYDPAKSTEAITGKLTESLFRIARIRDWLMLQSPQGVNRFPFALAVEHYRTNAKATGQVNLGDTLTFYIEKQNNSESWNKKKRYIYVFAIDSKGAMKLLFPNASAGNVENRFPMTDAMNQAEAKTVLFSLLVKPPTGADNYFMLTSEEPINNLSAFQQPGVISRGPSLTSVKNPLEALLFTGAKSRSQVTTPTTWSIDKIVLKSVEKSK